MEQTAVEWLHVKLAQSSQEELVGNINLWFQQAKEMEKQQIIDSWDSAYGGDSFHNGDDYYNEKFKNK